MSRRLYLKREQPENIHMKVVTGDASPTHGSTNTKIRKFETLESNFGKGYMTHSSTDALGDSITILKAGIYYVSYSDRRNTGASQIGLSLNTSSPTTSLSSLTSTEVLAAVLTVADDMAQVSVTRYFNEGDIIRCHTDGTPDLNSSVVIFFVSRVSPP